MATKEERLQQIWHNTTPIMETPATRVRVKRFTGPSPKVLLELPEVDPYEVLAGQMSQALRDEYETDPEVVAPCESCRSCQ